MASSHKMVALCLCVLLASLGVMVDAGHGMMGGLFGGGGKHGGHGGIETLLVAGLLASLLKNNNHGHGGHHHHAHHHHGHHGGYVLGRAAHAHLPYHYGFAYENAYGL